MADADTLGFSKRVSAVFRNVTEDRGAGQASDAQRYAPIKGNGTSQHDVSQTGAGAPLRGLPNLAIDIYQGGSSRAALSLGGPLPRVRRQFTACL